MKNSLDWKDLGAAFSLAVLWFTNVWREFIYSSSYNVYFDYSPFLEYTAMIVNTTLATLVFLALIKLSKGVSNLWLKRVFQIGFLALGLSAFCGLSSEIMKMISPKTTFFVNPLLPTIVLIICAAFSYRRKFQLSAILSNLKTIALFLLPFTLLTCAQLFWVWFNTTSAQFLSAKAQTEKIVSDSRKFPSRKKVVWVIFDALDYRAMSMAKENNADLSDIERLMSESFVAENAFSPNFGTQDSLPALLTGKPLKKTQPVALNDIMLYPADDSAAFNLRGSDNIVAEISDAGIKTGMAGWTHPYPRIFDDKISEGYWHSLQHAQCYSLPDCSGYIYRMSLQTIPLMTRFFPSLWFNENVNQTERHKFLTAKADELTARPDFRFLFFHFSIPHGPFINRRNSISDSYFDALEAVNDTVKRLRETLEKTGQWDNTVLIVSSDHFGRHFSAEQRAKADFDTRIPFIVKFPGDDSRLDYQPPFNTVVTKELILAILKGEITNSAELAARLDNLAATKPELINFRPDIRTFLDNIPVKSN